MLQDCIFWSFLNQYYVQIVGIVSMSSLPDLVKQTPHPPPPPPRAFIDLRCVSLQVVTNCSLAKIFAVNSPHTPTLLGGVCLTVIHSESLWFYGYYSELTSISKSHTQEGLLLDLKSPKVVISRLKSP